MVLGKLTWTATILTAVEGIQQWSSEQATTFKLIQYYTNKQQID
jgi:hypothetical protein